MKIHELLILKASNVVTSPVSLPILMAYYGLVIPGTAAKVTALLKGLNQ